MTSLRKIYIENDTHEYWWWNDATVYSCVCWFFFNHKELSKTISSVIARGDLFDDLAIVDTLACILMPTFFITSKSNL
jgi:hypothetical protein